MTRNYVFEGLPSDLKLSLTLETTGVEKEFYLFKTKLKALSYRSQILNPYKFGETNDGELIITYIDIIKQENSLSMFLDKKTLKWCITMFDKVLKNSKHVILFLTFEKERYTLIGTIQEVRQTFEKITNLDFIITLKKHHKIRKKMTPNINDNV